MPNKEKLPPDTMTTTDRTTEALLARRALAENATPGPWKLTGIPDVVDVLAVDTRDVVGVGHQMPDARHIAANSPDVVIADIDEILRLRTIVEHLQEENSRLRLVVKTQYMVGRQTR